MHTVRAHLRSPAKKPDAYKRTHFDLLVEIVTSQLAAALAVELADFVAELEGA